MAAVEPQFCQVLVVEADMDVATDRGVWRFAPLLLDREAVKALRFPSLNGSRRVGAAEDPTVSLDKVVAVDPTEDTDDTDERDFMSQRAALLAEWWEWPRVQTWAVGVRSLGVGAGWSEDVRPDGTERAAGRFSHPCSIPMKEEL